MYYVYVLKSLKDGGFYIGCTANLEQRLKSHNSGKTLSLKKRRPLEIIHVEACANSKLAYNREKQVKSYRGGEAFKALINQGGVA